MREVDPRVIELVKDLGKRPRSVVQYIIDHGEISTTEITEELGYNHAPRAARDVREAGIPLKMRMEHNENSGKKNAVYSFDNMDKLRLDLLKGRQNFPKAFKDKLFKMHDNKCLICTAVYTNRELQIDHRIPYEVSGDNLDTFGLDTNEYMPICPSDNRNKAFTCESCENWKVARDPEVCKTCYWASPETYEHIALKEERRLNLVFRENEIDLYKELNDQAHKVNETVEQYVINSLNDKEE